MDARKYKPTYAWRTLCKDVILLTSETLTQQATYRVTVTPIDINDLGALEPVEIGMYLKDFVGHTYKVIDTTTSTIDVSDDFWVGLGPQSGRQGIVYKSVWKHRSPYLAPIYYRHLDKSALEYSRQFELDELWSNDPNAKRIEFTAVDQPSIPDYRADITCMDGSVINPSIDYEDNPKFEIWQNIGSGVYSKQQVEPEITRSLSDGLIDSVLWSGTGELITGYIVISK